MAQSLILAVDPGKTTGWAAWDPWGDLQCGQITGRFFFYDWANDFFDTWNIDTVVVEKYTITSSTAKMSKQYDPLLINGWIEGLAHISKVKFVEQTPSAAKRVMTDGALQKLGWLRRGQEWEHAMDASRHLGLYLLNTSRGGIAEKILEL